MACLTMPSLHVRHRYLAAGVPSQRILLGLAAYGHVYTLINAK